jgi:cell division protein FtsA
MIGTGDIADVCDLAQNKCLPPGQRIIDSIRRPFRVDGRLVPDSPENLVGKKLEVGYWTVLGSEQKIADNIHIISGFNLQVHELILSSLASGFIVTNQEERQNGILVLDIGGGTTDFVLYRDGTPHTTGVLPVGGSHFTNDLGIGLRLRPAQAEKLKLRYGRSLVQNRNDTEKVWLDGSYSVGDRTFARREIEKITSARAWEFFDVVKRKLGNAFSPESCSCGVVLTGGGAKLPAIAECASKVFGTHAQLGKPSLWIHDDLCGPEFHTVVGTLYYGIKVSSEHTYTESQKSRLLRFWRRLFP